MTISSSNVVRSLIVILLLSWAFCEQFNVTKSSFSAVLNDSHLQFARVSLSKSPYERSGSIHPLPNAFTLPKNDNAVPTRSTRQRRTISLAKRQANDSNNSGESSFQKDELGWSNINAEVDIIVPMIVAHLQKLGIEYLELPNIQESISVSPIFITYKAGLFLTNGIVYNMAGIQRYGDAFMTYEDKAFVCKFNLIINSLQFEYDFLIKLMALEGYGKVIGSLDDTIIFGELSIGVVDTSLKLNDFRIMKFEQIHVQLDQRRIIRQLTGVILSPITNFFKDRITTSISDGLKEQMQVVMNDFNDNDPLGLKTFARQMLSGLTGKEES